MIARAWALKYNIAALFLAFVEGVIGLLKPTGVPHGIFATLSGLVGIMATYVHNAAQKELGK